MQEELVENIPGLESVVEVVAELELQSEAGAVIAIEAGTDHKLAYTAGTVEPQLIDRDTAVDKGHIQSIVGSIVDIAAVDTIALHLAAQQSELKVESE